MRSSIKYGAISIAILFFLLTITAILLPLLIDVQQYIPEIEKKISEKTGRRFSIGQDLNVSIFPRLSLSCSNLRLGNPLGFESGDFLEIDSFEARLKILPLLKRQIQISRFIIGGLDIYLEKRANGRVNYQFNGLDRTRQDLKSGFPGGYVGSIIEQLAVPLITVTDGRIIWNDSTSQNSLEITDVELKLSDVTLSDPFVVDFSGIIDEKPVNFDGSIGPLAQFSEQGILMIDLKFMVFENLTALLKGQFENSGQGFSYNFSLDIPPFSPKVVLADVGGDVSIMTAYPHVLNTLAVNTEVKGTKGWIVFENGVAELDDSHLDFSCFINGFTDPDIKFAVKVDSIDLTGYFRQPGEEPVRTGEGDRVFETGSDYSALHRLGIAGTIIASELHSHGGTLSDVLIQLKGEDGLFTIDPLAFSFYQGQVESKITLDVRKNRLKSSLLLHAEGVEVSPMMDDFFNNDLLRGKAKADIRVSSFGDSISAVIESLNGEGVVLLSDGTLIGYDLVGVVDNIFSDPGPLKVRPRTDFAELSSHITIKDGVVESRRTELNSPVVKMVVTGTADLVNKKLDLEITSNEKIVIKGRGSGEVHKVPLLITGIFSDVRVESDSVEKNEDGQEEPSKEADVKRLVDEKLPTPVGEDVNNLVGKSLVDPAVVAQRFGLQPENIRRIKAKKKFRQGTGKIQIAPLREGSILQL